MIDISSKIALLEEEVRITPYHKGTEHHIGRLKAKIAKLKEQERLIRRTGRHFGFIPKKEGDVTVVLVGPPSVGKSTLLNKLTKAQARVEEWPFTTLTVIPGMLEYKGAKIQIFDLPGIIGGASTGVGRGREILSATRTADLLILMVDIKTRQQVASLIEELKQAGISLPILVVVNKIDLLGRIPKKVGVNQIFISAETGEGLEKLKETIWEKLGLIRVYLKPKWKKPDFEKPLILRKGQTVADVAARTLPSKTDFKQILLWGPSARFPGQQVSLNHQLEDEDILNFG